jgi:hypothetical protein
MALIMLRMIGAIAQNEHSNAMTRCGEHRLFLDRAGLAQDL